MSAKYLNRINRLERLSNRLPRPTTAPMRLYALHRMLRAEALRDRPARLDPDFDLDRALAAGDRPNPSGRRHHSRDSRAA